MTTVISGQPKSKTVRAVGRQIDALAEQAAFLAQQAEQAEQAAQQAREARLKAEQDLAEAQAAQQALEAKLKAEQDEGESLARRNVEYKSKSVRAMKLPKIDAKVMERSYQRSGVVAGGTLLSSGARQATVTFKPATFRLLEQAATDNKVSLSEMVRQLVERGLHPQDPGAPQRKLLALKEWLAED